MGSCVGSSDQTTFFFSNKMYLKAFVILLVAIVVVAEIDFFHNPMAPAFGNAYGLTDDNDNALGGDGGMSYSPMRYRFKIYPNKRFFSPNKRGFGGYTSTKDHQRASSILQELMSQVRSRH